MTPALAGLSQSLQDRIRRRSSCWSDHHPCLQDPEAIAIAAPVCGCATIVSGTSQTVTLNSEPTGAACSVERGGVMVSQLVTPGSVTVAKGPDALTITCRKPGYAPVIGTDPSSLDGLIFGNVLFGGLTGVGVDLLTHADQSDHQNVIVRLHPLKPDPDAPRTRPSTALNLTPPTPIDPGT